MKRSDEISLEGNIPSFSVTFHSHFMFFSGNMSLAEMTPLESGSMLTASRHHVSCVCCASLLDYVHPSQIKYLCVAKTTQIQHLEVRPILIILLIEYTQSTKSMHDNDSRFSTTRKTKLYLQSIYLRFFVYFLVSSLTGQLRTTVFIVEEDNPNGMTTSSSSWRPRYNSGVRITDERRSAFHGE